MGQPTLIRASGRTVAKFGGVALPNGQGVMTSLDLNDYANTVLVNHFLSDDSNRQLGLGQLLYRARSVYTSDDFGPRLISLPMLYMEDSTHFLGGFLAALSQAGEQQLTFDNATYILAKYKGISGRKPARASLGRGVPLAWDFTLELIAKSPWFQDAAATTLAPFAVLDTGQTFNITYAGSVWAEPVWTVAIPAAHGTDLTTMQLANTMSGETLNIDFRSTGSFSIPNGSARTVTIDCGALTVTDNLGNSYDTYGSFPMLYGPAGKVNPFSASFGPSGFGSLNTLACSHYPRWQI